MNVAIVSIAWLLMRTYLGYHSMVVRTQAYIIDRLKYYPLIPYICYVWPAVNRILMFRDIKIPFFMAMHEILANSAV